MIAVRRSPVAGQHAAVFVDDQRGGEPERLRIDWVSYVRSQAGEGWTALPVLYDGGGFSGGDMERPALQRLMAEVDAGRIDMVVVYKVDRLTRSRLITGEPPLSWAEQRQVLGFDAAAAGRLRNRP